VPICTLPRFAKDTLSIARFDVFTLMKIQAPISHTEEGGSLALRNIVNLPHKQSRDISVGIALGYGLDDRGSRVRFPAVAGNFSLHHSVQNGSGAHPASYRMGTRGSFPEGKEAGACS
jgi:hypothetical protein